MKFGQHAPFEEPIGSYAVTMLEPYITLGEETKGYPRPGLMYNPTDVTVDPDGDIYVAGWGNHRVSIFDTEGKAIYDLIGDAQALSKWGQQIDDANPDMAKAWRWARSLEPQRRFTFPTAHAAPIHRSRAAARDRRRAGALVFRHQHGRSPLFLL